MLNILRQKIIKFLNSNRQFPVIAAIAAGLYPLLYYYDSNFTLVNSWSQFSNFVLYYLVVPAILFYTVTKIIYQIDSLKKYIGHIITILNIACFGFLIVISTYGFGLKALVLVVVLAFILGILFNKQHKKIVVFQFLLAAIVFTMLLPDFYNHFTYSNNWMKQPDDIEDVVFKRKPNIYFIQPDGYANFSELKKGNYNFDNSEFENFLDDNGFKLYYDYRSNYVSTLTSNSSMFAMAHHYYTNTSKKVKEFYNARQTIVGDNPVTSIFKKNNYKTFLFLEKSYLLLNRPKLSYDYCNIKYSEISFLARGFEIQKDILKDLVQTIEENKSTNNFYFICSKTPSHVSVHKNESKGIKRERETYLKDLQKTNKWLTEAINLIQKKDKNALVIIAADHGGYVGLNYSMENKIKQTDRNIIYSIFTSALAIKWPDNVPNFDTKIKTPVNLFRVLFTYLGEDEHYLTALQDDKSYGLISEGASYGIYEYIDEKGESVFIKKLIR
ncbi:MAG TPA: sulfatase-like hydrolase/transferase [Flavobacteriaceae bacterium]